MSDIDLTNKENILKQCDRMASYIIKLTDLIEIANASKDYSILKIDEDVVKGWAYATRYKKARMLAAINADRKKTP